MTDSDVKKARDRAVAAHAFQMYGGDPYIVHLDAVAALLIPYGNDARVVGYLHDILEDTPTRVETIEALFGKDISQAVEYLTDPPGATRIERKAKAYAKLIDLNPRVKSHRLALTCKPADRLANVRYCIVTNNVRMWEIYQAEHPTFYKAAYRPGLCDEFWLELEMLLHPAHRPTAD